MRLQLLALALSTLVGAAQVADLAAGGFRLVGMYFESKPSRRPPVSNTEPARMGRFIHLRDNPCCGVAPCADCHGAAGHGTEKVPRWGGLPYPPSLQVPSASAQMLSAQDSA